MSGFRWSLATLVAVALLCTTGLSVADSGFRLEPVTGGLHRVIDTDRHAGVVYIGESQAFAADLGSAEVANWLLGELDAREVTADYIALTTASEALIGAARPLVANGADIIAHDQAAPALTAGFPLPQTFSATATVWIDGTPIILAYPGASRSTDAIYIHWPELAAVYAGELVAVETLPDDFPESADIRAWYSAIDTLNRTDFTYLIAASGQIGIQQDGRDFGWFLRELQNRIRRAVNAGLTLEEISMNLKLNHYHKWQGWPENLDPIIASVYQDIKRAQP